MDPTIAMDTPIILFCTNQLIPAQMIRQIRWKFKLDCRMVLLFAPANGITLLILCLLVLHLSTFSHMRKSAFLFVHSSNPFRTFLPSLHSLTRLSQSISKTDLSSTVPQSIYNSTIPTFHFHWDNSRASALPPPLHPLFQDDPNKPRTSFHGR